MSNIDEAIKLVKKRLYVTQEELKKHGDYETVIDNLDEWNTIKQHIQEQDEEIERLETSKKNVEIVTNKILSQRNKLQSKLDKVKEICDKHEQVISIKLIRNIIK